MGRLKTGFAILVVLLSAGLARAAVVWPDSGDWVTLTTSTSNMTDPAGPNPSTTDIRGDSTYSSSFWFAGNNHLFFRMRVDRVPSSSTQAVWQFLFDTDSDTGIDWVLQLDAKSDDEVELARTTTEGTTFGDVVIGTTETGTDPDVKWTGTKSTYSRFGTASGSSFGGNADGFVDVAIPWSEFSSATGLDIGDSFRVGLSTATTNASINKDLPFALGTGDNVSGGFGTSNEIPVTVVPEPGTVILLGLGLLAIGLHHRRRRSRPA